MTALATPEAPARSEEARLASNSISLSHVLFVAVATMAPGAGAAYAIVTGAPFAGGSLTLSVVFALVGSLFVAVGIGQLAKHMSSAGGLASYVGTAMHKGLGFVVAWAYPFVYLFALPYLALVFGNLIATSVDSSAKGADYQTIWIVCGLGCLTAAFFLNYFGVQFGARVGLILGASEIIVLVVMSIWMIISAGGDNTASVFTTHHASVKGFEGMSGVIAGSVYGFLAFIGFEAAAPLAEETKDPKRTVPRAVVLSALLTGLFFVLTTYASSVYYGPGRMADFLSFNDGNAWIGLAKGLWGGAWVVLLITLLNSSLACANGASLAATRSLWSMGQSRTMPRFLGYTHPRWRSPVGAIATLFGIGAVLTVWLGTTWDPVTAYALFGTVLTLTVLPIYFVTALACPVFYFRYRRSELNWFLHVVAPVLGAAFLVPAFLTGAGIHAFTFVAPLAYPLNLAGPIVGAWYALGAAVAVYLLVKRPGRLSELVASHDIEAERPHVGDTPHLPHQIQHPAPVIGGPAVQTAE